MTTITILKLDHKGQETWRYQGKLLKRAPHQIVLEAFFERDDVTVDDMVLRPGDRFIETYFDDRWYNIFEVRDRADDQLKGWYCNICYPAEFHGRTVSYRDLALDLLVFPDGRQTVLDEDEFTSLPLSHQVRVQTHLALRELQALFTNLEIVPNPHTRVNNSGSD
jgi:predicted RNA-binding protein associated with RNAse of E/G family